MKNLKFLLAFALTFGMVSDGFSALTDFDRQEFTFENALADNNPGFESGTVKWTASGGTFVVNSGTQIVPNSKQFATWDSNLAGQTLQTAAVTVPKTGNCEFSIWIAVSSGTATHTITVNDGTNDLVSALTITTNTNALKHIVNFPCPSSGTVRGKLTSVASNEPSVSLDNARLGSASNIGTAQLATHWIGYSPTIGNLGTGSTVTNSGYWRQVGDSMQIMMQVVKDANNGSGALAVTFSLPAGYNIDSTKLPGANIRTVGFATDATAGTTGSVVYLNATQVYLYNMSAGAGQWNGSAFTANKTVNLVFTVPISGWAPSTIITPNAQGLSWSGTHGNDCIWTTTSTSLAAIATGDASCTFTQLSNRNFGSVTSATASGNNIPGIVFTPVVSGRYFICVNAHAYNSSSVGNYAGLAIHDGTSIIASSSQRNGRATSGTNDEMPHAMCGIATLNAGASRTVQLYANASAGTTTLAAGAAGVASVTWSIFNVDQPVQAILANSVTTANQNGDRIIRANFNCDAASLVTDSNTSGLTIGNISSGTCSITWPSFGSGAVNCTVTNTNCSAPSGTRCFNTINAGPNTTGMSVACISDAGGACTVSDFQAICIGPR